ncbi:MAG: hypothetical protein NTV86_09900 [Planctomycetota bacterium]|nr:hypothetical protein [Planctomycetota bacterium]
MTAISNRPSSSSIKAAATEEPSTPRRAVLNIIAIVPHSVPPAPPPDVKTPPGRLL